MNLLSTVTRSWKKSSQVQRLEKVIVPPNESIPEQVAGLTCLLERGSGASEKESALEKFLDLCEADEGVKTVMEREHLSRTDLRRLVVRLLDSGLGEWIKGHYAALSTIAYLEPLQYIVRSQRQGFDWQHIYFHLLEYWEQRIPPRELLGYHPGTRDEIGARN